jgi:hypothetical protein
MHQHHCAAAAAASHPGSNEAALAAFLAAATSVWDFEILPHSQKQLLLLHLHLLQQHRAHQLLMTQLLQP